MGTLDRTLQVFRELLAAKQPADLGEADAAIWSYLSSVDGLHAQTAALERLELCRILGDGGGQAAR